MAIVLLFTIWRGRGHDVIVRHQLLKKEVITVKNLFFSHKLWSSSDFVHDNYKILKSYAHWNMKHNYLMHNIPELQVYLLIVM